MINPILQIQYRGLEILNEFSKVKQLVNGRGLSDSRT